MPKRCRTRGRCYEHEKPTESIVRDTSYKCTILGYPQIRFAWAIEHLSSMIANLSRRRIKVTNSPKFPSEPPGAIAAAAAIKWQLRFQIDEDHVSLYVEPVKLTEEVEVNCYIDFFGNHQRIIAKADRLKFVPNSDELQGFHNLVEIDLLLKHVKKRGDNLVISCVMEIAGVVEERSRQSKDCEIQLFHVANDKLNADMGKLLEVDKFGDVELVVGNRTFSAYKGILAARSSVFAEMFTRRNRRVTITDMGPDLFQELLRYIYTDQVSNLDGLKFDLFAAAHRFNIESLKQLCHDVIMADISLETVSDVLKTGATFGVPIMKHHALTFIRKGPIGITRTRGWKELVRTHPNLADEALEVLAKKVAVANQRDDDDD